MNSNLKFSSAVLVFIFSGFLLSCNGDSSSNKADGTSAKTTFSQSSSKKSSKIGKCIANYSGTNMENLLTKEDIAQYVSLNLDDANVDDWRNQSPDYQHYFYVVDAGPDREKKIKTSFGSEVPISYKVGIGKIEVYEDYVNDPLDTFRASHHTLSESEKENAKAAMNKALGDSKDLSENQKSAAGKGTGSAIDQLKFTPIEGLGDAATWNSKYCELSVLLGRTVLGISVDVSDDDNKNMDIAKKLAEEALKKCKG